MYESFFQLEKTAFGMRPDPDMFYPTPQHREALAAILYGILHKKGFSVLWGDAGTGKTTILQSVFRQLPADKLRCSMIINPIVGTHEFLEMMLLNFGVEDIPKGKPRRLLRLQQLLQETEKQGQICVLIVDEAHRLTPELIEEIRLLTNFGLLQIVLAGQSELGQILDQHDMRQVKQRISVMVSLAPLAGATVRDYIAYRWTKVGGKDMPFNDQAVEAITEVSQGLPRLINLLCDNTLLAAFAREQSTVDAATVYEVGRDLRLNTASAELRVRGRHSSGAIALDRFAPMEPAFDGEFEPAAEAVPEPVIAAPNGKNGHSSLPWFRWPRSLRLKVSRSH